jgi:NAD(P)-dependent dehydrogenase (short-subunit alcohol dehydrogenase family)
MICQDRVIIVTGAGHGIGREHAFALAAAGACVVVNDFDAAAAEKVVGEITAQAGSAIASCGDVADWGYAAELVTAATERWGRLDALVNNAGFVRDRMLVSMTEQQWDDVIRVHLKGHAAPLHHAAAYWRQRAKAGEPAAGRVVNTTSGAGLLGSVGQANYAAAKAGIVALTQVAAVELRSYGVTVNAIAPAARTQMTEGVFASMARPESGFDAMDPANVSPLVVWLASEESGGVTGRVFEVEGGVISVATGWRHGPREDKGARWDPAEVGAVVERLLAQTPVPEPVYGAS